MHRSRIAVEPFKYFEDLIWFRQCHVIPVHENVVSVSGVAFSTNNAVTETSAIEQGSCGCGKWEETRLPHKQCRHQDLELHDRQMPPYTCPATLAEHNVVLFEMFSLLGEVFVKIDPSLWSVLVRVSV